MRAVQPSAAAACPLPLPGGGAGWAGRAAQALRASPGLSRALPQPRYRARLLRFSAVPSQPLPQERDGSAAPLLVDPSEPGGLGWAGRTPTPDAPFGVSPRGWALPSARRQPGTAAAFKVCFWSVLWFAGEKACLQTAAGELSRRGEEARLCQRCTKPPNSSKLS